ncbi:cytochrome P450 [Streptomyces sp. NPDC127084]|uniref:cytochrome P450 n=1 Tax=Streptomyces sp. NPDC127084 TaxID=3347133 RepID=UPI0036573D61
MAELPLFPFPGSSHRGPDPLFSRLRAEQPVVRVTTANGTPAWLITRHEDIRTALEDPRFSRAATYEPSAPQFEGLFQAPPGMIISLDPPDHTRLRSLAVQAFSPERIEDMRPRVRQLVDELLARVEKDAAEGPVDLLGDFTGPLALSVICELLGVPEQDRTVFHGWIRQFADVGGAQDEAVAAREQLGAYMAGLVEGKEQAPGDDVLSALIAARLGDDRLSTEELIGLGYTLLGAGGDSSASQLANSVLTLLARHRDVWQRLGEHPEEIPAAVEELLRGVNLLGDDTSGLPRIATEDITVGGVTIPAGDAVFLAFASANRDESVFADPDRLDFTRSHNPHLSFGHGIHRCLGGPLARIEIAVAVEELTRRYPDARLAVPEDELAWQRGDVNHRLVALPVLLHGGAPR